VRERFSGAVRIARYRSYSSRNVLALVLLAVGTQEVEGSSIEAGLGTCQHGSLKPRSGALGSPFSVVRL